MTCCYEETVIRLSLRLVKSAVTAVKRSDCITFTYACMHTLAYVYEHTNTEMHIEGIF